jgi:multidrug efflux system membrane fusion protein
MMSKRSLPKVGLVALLAAVPFVGACRKTTAVPEAPTPSVSVAPALQKEIVEWAEFTGRVEPVESVEVRPRVSGYLQKVEFQSGQLVKKGDVLFVIDPRWHQADFDRHQAEAERARVQLETARREADRTPQLLASRAISAEDAEARVARFQEAKAVLLGAEAARDSAKLDLEHTQVRAPISGRVSRALLTEGNYVSGVAGANSLLTTLVSVDPVYVYADVDEDTLLRFNGLVRSGKIELDAAGKVPAMLQLGDESDFVHRGHVESFDNRLDSNSGSILVRAIFPNPESRIVPGLFARIRLPLSGRHPVVLVSERSLATDQAQKYVMTVTPTNTVAYQAVTLGPVIDGLRVIRTGVQAGERVVVSGLQKVRPGMPVQVQAETAAQEPAQPAQPATH